MSLHTLRNARAWAASAAVLALLSGCALQKPPRPAAPAAAAGELAGAVRYPIARSELVLRVYRDGPLRQLGHNHVMASDALQGWLDVAAAAGTVRFRVELPVESLRVDEAARRAAAGPDFAAAVSDTDRDGTRRNLLGPGVLDAASHPLLVVTGETAWPAAPGGTVRLQIEVKGGQHMLDVPVLARATIDGVEVSSEFTVTHAQLGLVPFSVAMGAVRVREDIDVQLSLAALGPGG